MKTRPLNPEHVLHYLVTLRYARGIGGSIEETWMTDEFTTTQRGLVSPEPGDDRNAVVERLLVHLRDNDWDTYRQSHSFDHRLPKDNVLPEPIILLFELHPNEI